MRDLDPGIQAALDQRIADWGVRLGGAVTPARCEAAALAFMGYESRSDLVADYPADGRRLKNFEADVRRLLVEPDTQRAGAAAGLTLRTLVALMHRKPSTDFNFSVMDGLAESALCWDDVCVPIPISPAAARAFLMAVGCPTTPEGVAHGYDVTRAVAGGGLRVHANAFQSDQRITGIARLLPYASGLVPVGDMDGEDQWVSTLAAQARAARGQLETGLLSAGRARTRA